MILALRISVLGIATGPEWITAAGCQLEARKFALTRTACGYTISDGRELGVPLAWFPRLLHGSPEQRAQVRISARGLHWEALDEDLSVAGLLAGPGDQTRSATAAA